MEVPDGNRRYLLSVGQDRGFNAVFVAPNALGQQDNFMDGFASHATRHIAWP
ncbi:hypothetical protein [Paracoccus seriniphilus]|uniref:hypothetical protein n=1 Tax=Paracoccus seriniphilus TaxID=184748 RepID=UPI0015C6113E|nr:hypothetical protein [Paracoccus seriniphilus]